MMWRDSLACARSSCSLQCWPHAPSTGSAAAALRLPVALRPGLPRRAREAAGVAPPAVGRMHDDTSREE